MLLCVFVIGTSNMVNIGIRKFTQNNIPRRQSQYQLSQTHNYIYGKVFQIISLNQNGQYKLGRGQLNLAETNKCTNLIIQTDYNPTGFTGGLNNALKTIHTPLQ